MKSNPFFWICLFALFLFFQITGLSAESKRYTVKAVSGDAFRKNSSGEIKLAKGNSVANSDSIIASNSIYLLLDGDSGDIIELTKKGRYLVQNIPNGCRHSSNSLITNFLKVLANEVKHTNKAAPGYVAGKSKSPDPIVIIFPKTSKIISGEINFSWLKQNGADKYMFLIEGENRDTIFKKEISDTNYSLNISELNLTPQKCYYWSVSDLKKPENVSDAYCLNLVNNEEGEGIEQDLRHINDNILPSSPMYYLITAQLYEKKGYMINAYGCYNKLFENEEYKNVEDFKKLFENFKNKNEIKE